MRFFSKLVALCNVCFIISAILRLVEFSMRKNGSRDSAIPLPFLEGTIIVLGFLAIFLSIIFFLIIFFKKIFGKDLNLSRFILWFNIIMLPIEIWYSFFKAY